MPTRTAPNQGKTGTRSLVGGGTCQKAADVGLPGDAWEEDHDHQVQAQQHPDRGQRSLQQPRNHQIGAEQPEDRTGGANHRGVPGAQPDEEGTTTQGGRQINRQELGAAENGLKEASHQPQGQHVEADVGQ